MAIKSSATIIFLILAFGLAAALSSANKTNVQQSPSLVATSSLSTPDMNEDYKTYTDEVYGFTFHYPSHLYLKNETRTGTDLYIEFCQESTCGMEAGEFFIAQASNIQDVDSLTFNYATGWRCIGKDPYPIASESTSTLHVNNRTWLVTEVGYSNGGRFIQYLTWHQTLIANALISFAVSPETASLILQSFHSLPRKHCNRRAGKVTASPSVLRFYTP